MTVSPHMKGALLAMAGSILWGASGIGGQFLMQDRGLSPEWFASARMICAGLLLLFLDGICHRWDIFSIWKNRRDAGMLLLFAVAGMVGVQYTYFVTIALSNAAAATILQYTMPIWILLWTAFRERRQPGLREMACVALAIGGTALVVTHGEWGTVAIAPAALAWGLVSAVAAAFYVVQPKTLIRRWRSSLVVGWGMLLGGLLLSPFSRLWEPAGTFDAAAMGALAFVIILGTAAAFWMYLASVEYIEPGEAGLLNSMEPLSSILFSVLFFGMAFGFMECAGTALIICAVLAVTAGAQKRT